MSSGPDFLGKSLKLQKSASISVKRENLFLNLTGGGERINTVTCVKDSHKAGCGSRQRSWQLLVTSFVALLFVVVLIEDCLWLLGLSSEQQRNQCRPPPLPSLNADPALPRGSKVNFPENEWIS